MGKVVCEKCGTEFKFELAKDFECCPVCGASFSDDVDSIDSENAVQDDGLMYFDQIMIFERKPEYNNVNVRPDVVLKCEGCGKEHKPRKILYKRKDHYAPPLPRCPVCNSAMLKKITTGSKFLAAATVGMFALPYNSKTFECKDCGYRF